MSHAPFFIVGCGRSGTTLLRTMLHRHSQVAIPVESLFIIDYFRAMNHAPVERFRRLILREHEFSEWHLSLTEQDLAHCNSVRELIDEVHQRFAARKGATRWGQKTPRFIRYGELLKSVYPEARFIHILRDPRAVVNSLIRSNVHRSNAYYAARRWLQDTRAGLALEERYPEDVMRLPYEMLVSEPEPALRRVCEFLDLPFEPQMLEYYKEKEEAYSGYHEAIHARLQEPPRKERIDAWRGHLSAEEVALVEQVCMPLMAELGYAPEARVPVPANMIQQMKWERRTRGLFRQVTQYFRGRTHHLFYSIWRKFRLGLLLQDVSQVNS